MLPLLEPAFLTTLYTYRISAPIAHWVGNVQIQENSLYFNTEQMIGFNSSPLATDPPGQLDILGHDSHPLGVDGAKVGVLEQTHQVRLASLLQGHHSRALEPQVSLEILGNLTNETLEGQLTDEQFSRLLVPG